MAQPASQPASLWLTQTSRKACQLAASRTEASVGTGWSGSLASGSSWTERGDYFEFSNSVHLRYEAAHEVVVVVVREQVEPLIGDGHRVAVGTRGSSFAGKRICWMPRILYYAASIARMQQTQTCPWRWQSAELPCFQGGLSYLQGRQPRIIVHWKQHQHKSKVCRILIMKELAV